MGAQVVFVDELLKFQPQEQVVQLRAEGPAEIFRRVKVQGGVGDDGGQPIAVAGGLLPLRQLADGGGLGVQVRQQAIDLNFVSFKGGEAWEPEVVVGSFQMKVIGTKGVSQLIPTNTLVSTQDGMAGYTVKDNSVSVIVTTDCTVTFESNGGTEVPSQTVQYGEKVKKPEDPIREGYHLEGWYRDLDRTQKWDFHKDTVKGNMTLYANWAEGAAAGSVTWWIIGGVGLLALLLILLALLGKKKVRFETSGGTELEAVSVKRGSVIGEVMTPTKPGAVFGGWYADQALTKPWDTQKDPVRSNMTLYARWM